MRLDRWCARKQISGSKLGRLLGVSRQTGCSLIGGSIPRGGLMLAIIGLTKGAVRETDFWLRRAATAAEKVQVLRIRKTLRYLKRKPKRGAE